MYVLQTNVAIWCNHNIGKDIVQLACYILTSNVILPHYFADNSGCNHQLIAKTWNMSSFMVLPKLHMHVYVYIYI